MGGYRTKWFNHHKNRAMEITAVPAGTGDTSSGTVDYYNLTERDLYEQMRREHELAREHRLSLEQMHNREKAKIKKRLAWPRAIFECHHPETGEVAVAILVDRNGEISAEVSGQVDASAEVFLRSLVTQKLIKDLCDQEQIDRAIKIFTADNKGDHNV
jgi:hypothetical protein